MTTTFKELGLSDAFLKTLATLKITEPTEIQEKSIPLALAGRDIIGGSATGSGKTLAFGASIIEKKTPGKGIQVLILTPTRELAEQVGKTLCKFAHHTRLQVAIVYGGVGLGPQVSEMKYADIVVGTPGRILDHLERGSFNLRSINTLVLDEADRMLDMGFIEDVTRIIEACPRERQTFLFSATISGDIVHMSKHYMRDPVEVSSASYVDPSKLEQIFYDVPRQLKFSLLVHLLKQEKSGLVMVFCSTRHNTDFVGKHLKSIGIEAMAIHGGLSQSRRNAIMKAFHGSQVYVLVCTDVAARGLDIKNVTHVYNYDLPPTSKEYVHRIGRTARAGKEGKAISLVADRDYDNFRQVLRDTSLQIKQESLPEFETIQIRIAPSHNRGFRDRPHGRDNRSRGYGQRSNRGYRGR